MQKYITNAFTVLLATSKILATKQANNKKNSLLDVIETMKKQKNKEITARENKLRKRLEKMKTFEKKTTQLCKSEL